MAVHLKILCEEPTHRVQFLCPPRQLKWWLWRQWYWWLWWHCFSGGCDDNYSGDCDIRKTLGGSWEKVGKQIPLLNYKTKALLTFPFYVDLVLLIFICKHHLQITIMRIFQLHCIEGIQGWIETESNQAIAGFLHLPNSKFLSIALNQISCNRNNAETKQTKYVRVLEATASSKDLLFCKTCISPNSSNSPPFQDYKINSYHPNPPWKWRYVPLVKITIRISFVIMKWQLKLERVDIVTVITKQLHPTQPPTLLGCIGLMQETTEIFTHPQEPLLSKPPSTPKTPQPLLAEIEKKKFETNVI